MLSCHFKMPLAAQAYRFCKFQQPVRLFTSETKAKLQRIRVANAGQAIRSALNQGTTGAPYALGRLMLAGGSVLGAGALCYYGLGLSKSVGAVDQAALWPQYVRDRIHKTYLYLGAGLGLTAGSAVAVFRSPIMMNLMTKNSITALVATFAAMIGTSVLCRSIPYGDSNSFPTKLLAWAAHCAVMGAILAPLAIVGGPILMRAALYSAGIVGGLSTIAATAPSDKFLNMGGMLGIGLGVVFAASIGTFFLPPHTALGAGIYSLAIYGGLLLFAGFMLYDTQRLVDHARRFPDPYYTNSVDMFDPINAQLSIYANTLNIFIRMVMILSGSSRKK